MSTLYIVATPIGNLSDISFRAIDALKSVDLILCEDTRVTRKLLDHYKIKTPMLSYHEHSKLRKVEEIIKLLKDEKSLALVSDAGVPGISDPGNKLIKSVFEELGSVKIIPIPGASAVTAAASISSFPMDKFVFMGFPPAKKKRNKFFEEVKNLKYPVVLYESPHRIIKTLNELRDMCGNLKVVVCRELTKKFETTYRGDVETVIIELEKEKIRGEFVLIIEK